MCIRDRNKTDAKRHGNIFLLGNFTGIVQLHCLIAPLPKAFVYIDYIFKVC